MQTKKIVGLQTFIWENNLKSMILLIVFPFLMAIVWFLISILFGVLSNVNPMQIFSSTVVLPILGSFIWLFIAWAFNKSIVSKLTGAHLVTRRENSRLYNIVENLCISRGLPTPEIYIIDDDGLNAFASGLNPKDSFIAFTRGLVDSLNDDELEAVAGHELTHIINRDSKLMLISFVFVGVLQIIADIIIRIRFNSRSRKDSEGNAGLLIFLIQVTIYVLAFVVAVIVQMAISRKREFLADAGSVELTKRPDALISALRKISKNPHVHTVKSQNIAQMFISNPLGNRKSRFFKLFMTHPPIEERIAVLEQLS